MDDNKQAVKDWAKQLGMMLAEGNADFYDVVEAFSEGYALAEGSTDKAKGILTQIGALHELQSVANNTVRDYVDDARAEHASWTQIGDALDTSKQAAQQKYSQ